MNKIISFLTFTISITFFVNCDNTIKSETKIITEKENTPPPTNKGVGPYADKTIELSEIDKTLVISGKNTFANKCMACHSIDTKIIGPALSGMLNRRTPEWIMNMILSPDLMIKEDPDAIALLKEYNNIPMMPLGLTDQEAREVLEYLRTESK